MDIVKNVKIDWLKYKWWFIAVSVVLIAAGSISLLVRGLNLGVDFTGGTLVYVKFQDTPELERIRSSLRDGGLSAEEVTLFDDPSKNEVQIRMGRIESDEADNLNLQSESVLRTLHAEFDPDPGEARFDLNNISKRVAAARLSELDPEGKKESLSLTEFDELYQGYANQVIDERTRLGGVIKDFSELAGLSLPSAVTESLQNEFYLGSFNLISLESVGPKVGMELQERARAAIFFSLIGMLIYIAFRFRPINGLAAIVALFHDVFITLGFLSIFYKEISLTVVAALMTLVGYSINDTIVVFDRVRENSKLMRRFDFGHIINTSINQTLNRTILTSGMTFLAVFALYMLGGQVLNGFSFALLIGIIVGTYSSVAIASPIVLWWQNFSERRKARA
jgi:preprotein translocase subunit SecF